MTTLPSSMASRFGIGDARAALTRDRLVADQTGDADARRHVAAAANSAGALVAALGGDPTL
jgi:hypothetical protein